MTPVVLARRPIPRPVRWGIVAAVAGLAACLFGVLRLPQALFAAYLAVYLFWLGIALGSLAVLMLHHLVGGGWGFLIRRTLEAAAGTLPLMAILFLPIAAGMPEIYSWARPGAADDPILRAKSGYLNGPFFIARAGVYFAVWILLAVLLDRASGKQDRTGDPETTKRLKTLSGPGLVVYGLTVSFAAVDWGMSLEPHWVSTIYGMTFMVGQALSALAFATFMVSRLAGRPPVSHAATPQRLHDLGNLLLAFVMLWAYVAFAQYLLIWSANLPEEVPWYLTRTRAAWKGAALFLVVFHFAAPFLFLLSRDMKRTAERAGAIAALVLSARLVDYVWLVVPPFAAAGAHPVWLVPAAGATVGGAWVALFARNLRRRELLPPRDPRFAEAVSPS